MLMHAPEETMRLILNVIWLVFGGLWLALAMCWPR